MKMPTQFLVAIAMLSVSVVGTLAAAHHDKFTPPSHLAFTQAPAPTAVQDPRDKEINDLRALVASLTEQRDASGSAAAQWHAAVQNYSDAQKQILTQCVASVEDAAPGKTLDLSTFPFKVKDKPKDPAPAAPAAAAAAAKPTPKKQ